MLLYAYYNNAEHTEHIFESVTIVVHDKETFLATIKQNYYVTDNQS